MRSFALHIKRLGKVLKHFSVWKTYIKGIQLGSENGTYVRQIYGAICFAALENGTLEGLGRRPPPRLHVKLNVSQSRTD